MQVKADDILNLPQFTFGMYTRAQGFLPVRGVPNALGEMEQRKYPEDLQHEMEGIYGPTKTDEDKPPDDPWAVSPEPDEPGPEGPEGGGEAVAPEVEVI